MLRQAVQEWLPKSPVKVVQHISKKDDLEPGGDGVTPIQKIEVPVLYTRANVFNDLMGTTARTGRQSKVFLPDHRR